MFPSTRNSSTSISLHIVSERSVKRVKVVYRITYPNGKIYVGVDLTGTTTYMGSPSQSELIAADFTAEQLRDFTIRKEILWESATASDSEARGMEVELIRSTGANDPSIGYNLRPKFRSG